VQPFGIDLDYVAFMLLFCIGLGMLVTSSNLLKKLLGLNIMETAVFAFLVTAGSVDGGAAPILHAGASGPFTNPLPQAMVLTGIVVAVSVTAVALALIVQIHAHYGTIDVDALRERP